MKAAWLYPATWSLDGPLVAVAWLAVVNQLEGYGLGAVAFLLTMAAIWLGYAADRYVEARHATVDPSLPRYRMMRHRRMWLTVWTGVLVFSLLSGLLLLPGPTLRAGLGVALLALGYTLWPHQRRKPPRLVTAMLFTVGALFFAGVDPARWSGPLVAAALMLMMAANAQLHWLDTAEQTGHDRNALMIALGPAGAISLLGTLAPGAQPYALAALLSVAGLTALTPFSSRLQVTTRRMMADVALGGSPLLVVALLHLL